MLCFHTHFAISLKPHYSVYFSAGRVQSSITVVLLLGQCLARNGHSASTDEQVGAIRGLFHDGHGRTEAWQDRPHNAEEKNPLGTMLCEVPVHSKAEVFGHGRGPPSRPCEQLLRGYAGVAWAGFQAVISPWTKDGSSRSCFACWVFTCFLFGSGSLANDHVNGANFPC